MGWRLARALETLRGEVRAAYPGTTVWTIGDPAHARRASDHNPHPTTRVVTAIDVLGGLQAAALWSLVVEGRDPRVKYAIHAGQIISSTVQPWKVRPYNGANPHTNHIHISVGRGPDGRTTRADLYDNTAGWQLVAGRDLEAIEMLKRGDKGNAVKVVQRGVRAWAKTTSKPDPLPKFGEDGDYGGETEAAVKAYQRAAHLDPTGVAGDVTIALLARYDRPTKAAGTPC